MVGSATEPVQLDVVWCIEMCHRKRLSDSYRPLFLRTDAVAGQGVETKIRLLTWLRPLALGLVAVAAVVTPLGLYDDIVPSKAPQLVSFAYVQDSGPMGYGTPVRSDLGFTRQCGNLLPLQCPGTTVEITYTGNETFGSANITNDDYDMRIPRVLAELYQSGLEQQPRTVASFFDIQSRYYSLFSQAGVEYGAKYIVEAFRYLSNMVLNNAIEAVEGLIVDTVTGGIALRNHTAPCGVSLGAEWTEDLLWIEPETACVDTNISVEFQLPLSGFASMQPANISLVDNGGFANLVHEWPYIDMTNAQANPNLQGRSYRAAWLVNAYTMLVMNLTRPSPDAFGYLKSEVGNKYPVTNYQTAGAKANGLYIINNFHSLLDPDASPTNLTLLNAPGTNYSNPFGLGWQNYSDIALLCSGVGGADQANLTNMHVECGMIFGAAQRRDGSKTLVMEPETWWTQKVYTCATAMKASIKEVRFRWNATEVTGNTLKALTVVSISEKAYASQESMPLWGVETVDFELQDLYQLWGLVSPELETSVNLSTIRAPHLYLPGYGGSGLLTASSPSYENLPASHGFADVLSAVYELSSGEWTDYSGGTNIAMYARWRDYSTSAAGVKTIPSLIWTDLAANKFVGARSWSSRTGLPPNLLQKRDGTGSSDGDQTLVPVTVYERQIRYHWLFAIPACLALLLFFVVLVAALVSVLSGKGLPARVRHYLFHLSSGRLLGEMQHPGECDKLASTNEWLARVGKRPADLRNYVSHEKCVGAAAAPFLGKTGHTASSTDNKQDGTVTEAMELRPAAVTLS